MPTLEKLPETGQRVGMGVEKLPSPHSCPPLLRFGSGGGRGGGAAAGIRMTHCPQKGLGIGRAKGGGRGPRERAAADPSEG